MPSPKGCFTFLALSLAVVLGAYVYMGASASRPPRPGVYLSPDEHEIVISGEFVPGLERRFRRVLDSSFKVRVVRLFSHGGYVTVAGRIRNDIRERGLDTLVSGQCASACTIAFMAGQRRVLARGGQLGFHSFSLRGRESDRTTQEMELHYGYYGLDQDFVARIGRTPATSVWYPSAEELLKAQVITETVTPSFRERWW